MSESRGPGGVSFAAGRTVILVLGIALVVGAVALFVLALRRIPAATPSLAKPVAVANVPATGSAAFCVPRTNTLRVALVISKFEPVAQTVSLAVYVCARPDILEGLARSTDTSCSDHPASKMLLQYEVQLPSGGRERENVVEASLCSLIRGSGTGPESGSGCQGGQACIGEPKVTRLGEFVLPLAAAQQRYPFDWYAGGATVAVEVEYPAKEVIEGRLQATEEYEGQRFELALVNGQQLAPFVLSASANMSTTKPVPAVRIALCWQREGVTRLYVLVIALLPLILGLLFFVVLFSSRLSARAPVGPELIAGVAAVLLGVLPIRTVLVPSEISTLTLLDYWLGLEMAVLVALPCFAVWRALGREKPGVAEPRSAGEV
jgi:hypothetical protein